MRLQQACQSVEPARATLEYGQAASRRWRWIRRIVLLLLLAGGIVAGIRWGPGAWRQAVLLRAQHQCLHYTAPTDQVVYEEDPQAAAKLLGSDASYMPYPIARGAGPDPRRSGEKPSQITAAARVPACWRAFDSAWTRQTVLLSPRQAAGAVAFLHERTSPAGHRRLVCVRIFPETSTFTTSFIGGYNYEAPVITPASLASKPVEAMRAYAIDVISGWPRHPPALRIYAGQIDPKDPSHFTIRYQMWGQSDVLDGRLLDNDTVTLKPRQRPEDR